MTSESPFSELIEDIRDGGRLIESGWSELGGPSESRLLYFAGAQHVLTLLVCSMASDRAAQDTERLVHDLQAELAEYLEQITATKQ